MNVLDLPLSWYVSKLECGEPFSSLLYGDGEFRVMSGKLTGQVYTNYRERITAQLVYELNASLDDPDSNIVRGSDPHVLDWTTYGGQDVAMVREASDCAQAVIGSRQIAWTNGCVWDESVREGKLGTLLKVINERQTMIFACGKVCNWFHEELDVSGLQLVKMPERDACNYLDHIKWVDASYTDVFIVCTGLGAIPLIMRLRKRYPQATFLDLGSTFDMFAKIGAERGWRRELYQDEAAWRALVAKNLEGV